jgi:extradiol dioxygenase family protein
MSGGTSIDQASATDHGQPADAGSANRTGGSGYRVTQPFHLAFPVHDLAEARRFYGELLGCPEGRSADDWVDFDLYGHQIVAHLAPEEAGHRQTSAVDGDQVPVRHFGVILGLDQWERLAERLRAAGTRFVIEPHIRFKGLPGEQATMFFLDPSGNALEFKAFGDPDRLFARQ